MSCPRSFLGLLILVAAAALLLPEAEAGFVEPPTTLRASPPELQSYFGHAVASGDVNSDGYDDVIVGSPLSDAGGHPDSGEVRVFLGPSLSSVSILPNPAAEDGASFGYSVAAGDVNGDNAADLIVGAPYADVGSYPAAGRIFVFLGPSFSSVSVIESPLPGNGAHFGSAVATGDVNGDGKADLLVGAPDAPVSGVLRAGRAFVFLGPSFSTSFALQDSEPEGNAGFGRALAAGDLDNDGDDDVIVGAPDSDMGAQKEFVDAGQAFVFRAPSLDSMTPLQDQELQSRARFGRAVAAGDFDNDGYDDVLVGAFGSDVPPQGTAGQAFVFRGPSLVDVTMLQEPVPELDAYFGFSLTAGDVNGDGYDDAVIGTHDADSDHLVATSGGEAYIFLGPSFGPVIAFEDPVPEKYAFFARSVAVGDVNNDGRDDFIAGAPWSDVGAVTDAGEAFVFLAEPDADGDGISDAADNCPTVYNLDQLNGDGGGRPNGSLIPGEWAGNPAQDGLGDVCDSDNDNDALPDSSEYEASCPYRLVADSDGDRALDGYEVAMGSDPCAAASKPVCTSPTDSDGDGFTDCMEHSGYNTCAFAGDTAPGYTTCASPTDSDGDGCADWIEIVDIDGNRKADMNDVMVVAKRMFNLIPASDSDPVLDMDKNGKVNISDAMLAARNSSLIRPHLPCPW